MATQVYVASLSDGCPMACVDGLAMASKINKFADEEGRATSVKELDRLLRETVHRDDILLYGLGVYCREIDDSDAGKELTT